MAPASDEKRIGFEKYANSLFDTGLAMMLPAPKTDLGKHCFGYASLLAPEFYGDKPKDTLALVADKRPLDELSDIRVELDEDWTQVPKDSENRVAQQDFVDYFINKHGSKLTGGRKDYERFLKQIFKSALAMMLPEEKSTLGGHCFRYGALMAGEFYFGSKPGADVLRVAVAK